MGRGELPPAYQPIRSDSTAYAALPDRGDLRTLIKERAPSVSVISYVEVLGFHRLDAADLSFFEEFFAAAAMLSITPRILEAAVRLRQARKMGLGDALIAATALVHSLQLVTRNTDDFIWIEGLRLLNPLPD